MVAALALAQMEIKPPQRNRTVQVQTNSGGSYTFKYATLDAIIEAVREPLAKNGLWFTQIVALDDGGNYVLITRLLHTSNQYLSMTTPLIVGGKGGNQDFGSALTFMRRYALSALLGVAADEDDDANSADGNTVQNMVDRPPREPKPDVVAGRGAAAVSPLTKPTVISLAMKGDAPDWMGWCQLYAASVKAATSPAVVEEWGVYNEDILQRLQKDAPKAYGRLQLTVDEVRKKLEDPNG